MIKIQENEFQMLVDYMRETFGINLVKKRNLIEGRLSNQIVEGGYSCYMEYLQHVFADESGRELANLVNRLTTNHTYFLREEMHFQYLRQQILPELEQTVPDRDIRIWSAGCSSGEEPYTIAMLLNEYFGSQKQLWDSRILATDISTRALEKAQAGLYAVSSLEHVSDVWRKKYFRTVDQETCKIADFIRQEVIFRPLNLMQETFPFRSRFHVIFCRNVMIYFDRETKLNLINHFYELTEPGGYLFIGHAESIPRGETEYQYIQPAIYRKRK